MVGFLYLTGQKINFFNIIAIPAVIGIGVDNGVHVVHRYRVEGLASLRRLVRNLVRTLLAATLTTVLSFLSLLFAHHPGIRSLGEAASCGLVTTFLAAGFFLPAVIYVHAKASARIALASRRRGTVVWTLSFDPLTEFLKHRLREKKVPFRIMALDELPTAERGMAARMLKEEARGGLHLPVLENGGKLESLGKKDIPAIRALLDALPK